MLLQQNLSRFMAHIYSLHFTTERDNFSFQCERSFLATRGKKPKTIHQDLFPPV